MNVSAVLLVGGESRRMGRDKATVIFRGQPLWQIQLDLLRRLRPAEIFVSARSDPPWRPSEAQFVSDEAPSRGPLSGVAAALALVRTDHLLVLAIDMPFMTESYLRSLCNRIEHSCGVIPMIDDHAEPLAAIYPKDAEIDFMAALSGSDFSLQSLTKELTSLGRLRHVNVSKTDRKLFRSLNQPSDLDAKYECKADQPGRRAMPM